MSFTDAWNILWRRSDLLTSQQQRYLSSWPPRTPCAPTRCTAAPTPWSPAADTAPGCPRSLFHWTGRKPRKRLMNTDNNNNRRHCFLTDPRTRASYQRRYRRIFLFGAAAAAEFPEDAPGRGSQVSDGAETDKNVKVWTGECEEPTWWCRRRPWAKGWCWTAPAWSGLLWSSWGRAWSEQTSTPRRRRPVKETLCSRQVLHKDLKDWKEFPVYLDLLEGVCDHGDEHVQQHDDDDQGEDPIQDPAHKLRQHKLRHVHVVLVGHSKHGPEQEVERLVEPAGERGTCCQVLRRRTVQEQSQTSRNLWNNLIKITGKSSDLFCVWTMRRINWC